MVKKVVFIIYRTNEFKYLSSTINAFFKKKIPIELLFISDQNKKSFKYYLDPKKLNTPLINKIPKKYFYNVNDLQDFFIKDIENISLIFSLVFLSKSRFLIDENFLRLVRNKWCVINHGTDNYAQIKDEQTDYNYNPIFFADTKYYIRFGKKWVQKFVKKKNILLSKKIIFKIVGNSMYSREIFKIKKNTKSNKLIYLPYPYLKERYNSDFSFQAAFVGQFINMYLFYRKFHKSSILYAFKAQISHWIINSIELIKNFKLIKKYYYHQNELQVVKTISKFCKKNNLQFIIKPRLKFPFPNVYNKFADKIIYDDESKQFPSILQKEIAESKIVIGSNSSAIYETAMFNKLSINIEAPKIAFNSNSSRSLFTFLPNTEWNFKKVVLNFKINEFIEKFDNMRVEDLRLDRTQHKKYLKKFCGIEKKYDTGEKIYNEIKKYLK